MKIINIKNAQPGMVLAEKVCGPNGRLLLEKGAKISEKQLRVLNMWGVAEVSVEEAPSLPLACSSDQECFREALERVEIRFALSSPDEPPLPELRKLCAEDYAARMSKGWRPAPAPCMEKTPLSTTAPSLDALTSSDKGLVSLPDIYAQINKAVQDPSCTANRLADIISKDTGMSAKLLRVVNSSSMGQGRKVDTLSRSVMILGLKEISQLALGVSLLREFGDAANDFLPMPEFWKHSLSCGVLARLLAARMQRRDLERYFVAGMLHDIGRLIMLRIAPEHLCAAMRLACEQKIALLDAERQVFGYDHCQVAARLMSRWNLPISLTDLIVFHHEPLAASVPQDVAIISVANAMVTALEYGQSGQHAFTSLAPSAWELLGESPNLLPVLVSQATRQLDDIFAALLG